MLPSLFLRQARPCTGSEFLTLQGLHEPSFVPAGLIISRLLNCMGSRCCLKSLCANTCPGYLCSRIIQQPFG